MQGFVILILAINMAMVAPSYAQIRTPCGASSMLTSFIPCMSFLMNRSSNDSLPTSQCCKALKSLTSGGMDCFCLIVTGTVPFSIPINRTLATYLPQVCDIPGVLLQCKTYGSSLPAPGPVSLGLFPSAPSGFTSSPSVKTSSVIPSTIASSQAPLSDTTPLLTPPSSPSVDSNTPSTIASGGRSQLTPSSAMPSYSLSPSFLLIALGFVVLKYY